jgi:hypothetical protein
MTRSRMRARIVIALGVGLIAAAVAAPTAGADPVTGGKTALHPDQDTFEGFADMSIAVGATGAARDGRNAVSFPIRGGDVSEGPKGSIEHTGGLVFDRNTSAGGTVKFTKFTIRIGASGKTKLFAKSEHSEVRFLDLDLKHATIGGSAGTDLKIKNADASLAKQGAEVLSETFDFPFRKGIPIGTMTIKATLSS